MALVLSGAAAASIAFVAAPAAGGEPTRRAGCDGSAPPKITSLEASAVDDTSVAISFSFTSGAGGTWTIDISSPKTTTFSSTFNAPGGSVSERVGGLIPHTHYRGTLSVRGDCGSDAALIDFRTPATPPAPACSGPPAIDGLQVASISESSAVVSYTARSGDPGTAHVLVDPGGLDIAGVISPPGGGAQVPLSGLAPSTPYSVTLVVRNGCGETSSKTQFTTLRHLDCTSPPSIDSVGVASITERSAVVTYRARSDGRGTFGVTVDPGGVDVAGAISAPGRNGRVSLSKLVPATKYTVRVAVRNDCGQAGAGTIFTSRARIVVSVTGSGRVTSAPAGISCTHTCTGRFGPGSTVRLTAHSVAGWRFASWGGDCRGSAATCSLKATNGTVRARFRRAP